MQNSNNHETKILERIWIFILFAIGLLAQILLFLTQESKEISGINASITLVFFAVIFIIFSTAQKGHLRGLAFRNDLNKARATISSMHEQGETNILSKLDGTELFQTQELKSAFSEYLSDARRMQAITDSAEVDIENYINQRLLEDTISMHFLNQIPGAMTGLGIFGTFVGLSVGLSSFNFTGGDIAGEIQPLMDGIKVAFHTSIIGLIYSLGFNWRYRDCFADECRSLDNFLQEFRNHVVDITEDGTNGTFVKYQQRMIELLNSQIVNQELSISLQSEQNELSSQMSDTIVTKMTGLLADMIVPEIQKMSETVERFAENTQKSQMDELQRLVDSFVKEMNAAMGDSFKGLAKVIEETNHWQRRSLDEMEKVLAEIGKMTVDLASIDQSVESAIEKVNAYTQKIDATQELFAANMMSMNIQAEHNNEWLENCKTMITDLRDQYKDINCATTGFLSQASAQADRLMMMGNDAIDLNKATLQEIAHTAKNTSSELSSLVANVTQEVSSYTTMLSETTSATKHTAEAGIRELTALGEKNAQSMQDAFAQMERDLHAKIEQMVNLQDLLGNDLSKAAQQLGNAAEKFDQSLEKELQSVLMQLDKEMASALEHLSGTISGMAETTKKMPLILDTSCTAIENIFTELQEKLDQYLEYADKLHHRAEQMWQQFERENRK